MKLKSIFFIAITVLFLSGCAQTKFNLVENKDGAVATYDRSQHYFIGGIGQQKNIDPAEICGGSDNIVRTQTEMTLVNWFASVITFGIYTPTQALVYCKQ